jgi:hypothetical protein
MLAGSGADIGPAARVFAGYLVSRNMVIAATLLGASIVRARTALSVTLLLTALVQFLDAVMNCVEGRWPLVPVVAVLGILFLFGAFRMSRNR